MAVSLQHGNADVVLHGDDAHEENTQCGDKLRHGGTECGLHTEVVNDSSKDARQRINILTENQRYLID